MSQAEKEVGIEGYLTSTRGINGKIKVYPEDFVVDEAPIPLPEGDSHTILEIRSINWETHALAEKLAKLLVTGKGIMFAGTKDRRAVSTQHFSIPAYLEKREAEEFLKTLPRVELLNIYHSGKGLRLGNLAGNRFAITIRDHHHDEENFKSTLDHISSFGGFPNFFGLQRFGSVRLITHIVGKYLIQKDFERAVYAYLGNGGEKEREEVKEARERVREGKLKEALDIFPKGFSYERRMIEKLLRGRDYVSCLRSIPLYMRKLFVHAYQSFLFNRMLSERLKSKTLKELREGDYILPFENETFGKRPIRMVQLNEMASEEVKRCGAYITGLVPGYNSDLRGELESRILEEEEVTPQDFIIPEMPECSSKGTIRTLLTPVKELDYEFNAETALLRFFLFKGCYATSLLREIMKN